MSDNDPIIDDDLDINTLKKEFLDHEKMYIKELLFDPKSTLDDLREDIGMLEDCMRYSFDGHGENKTTGIVGYISAYAAVIAARKDDRKKFGDLGRYKTIAITIGWAIETAVLRHELRDDVAEGRTVNKYGKKPWHLIEGVGLRALLDIETTDSESYTYLKRVIQDDDLFFDLWDVIEECKCKVAHGYALDMDGRRQPFKMLESEPTVSEWKASIFTEMPIKMAVILAGVKPDSSEMKSIDQVTSKLAIYYQHLRDFQDYFTLNRIADANPKPPFNGNRCNWLLRHAMAKGTNQQKDKLKEVFEKRDDESKATVRKIFSQLREKMELELNDEEQALTKTYQSVGRFEEVFLLVHRIIFEPTRNV